MGTLIFIMRNLTTIGIFSIIFLAVLLVSGWFVFQKMGRPGWAFLVPFYGNYVLFDELYGNGWRFLLLLIPLFNIYLLFRLSIDLAHRFERSTLFGVGMALVPWAFMAVLAFAREASDEKAPAESRPEKKVRVPRPRKEAHVDPEMIDPFAGLAAQARPASRRTSRSAPALREQSREADAKPAPLPPFSQSECCVCGHSLSAGYAVLFADPDGREARIDEHCYKMIRALSKSNDRAEVQDWLRYARGRLSLVDPVVARRLRTYIRAGEDFLNI